MQAWQEAEDSTSQETLCGICLLQVRRLFSLQQASALRELLCGCDGVDLRHPLRVNSKSFNNHHFFLPLDSDSAGDSDCIFGKGEYCFYKIPPRKFPYGTTYVISGFLAFFLSYPVRRINFDSIRSEQMDLYWWIAPHCILQCHCGSDKNLWLMRALYIQGLVPFFSSHHLSSSCSRHNKVMQLCSCQDHSSKGYFLALTLPITLHLSFIFTSSPHPLHPSSQDVATTWVPLRQSNSSVSKDL